MNKQEFLFPQVQLEIKSEGGKNWVFDALRRKFVRLTPEEEVRQYLIRYMIDCKGYPSQLIAIEREFEFHKIKKRFDLLVFDRNGNPLLIAECKAPNIVLNQEVVNQVGIYNAVFGAKYLLITNGLKLFVIEYLKKNKHLILNEIPNYNSIC